MKALIFQNKVVDLQDKEFPCSPEMTWIDCDDPDAKIGYGYSDGKYTNPYPEMPVNEQLKAQRDNALSASDWKMMRANESGVKAAEWKKYRQDLRDLPANDYDPWPVEPE